MELSVYGLPGVIEVLESLHPAKAASSLLIKDPVRIQCTFFQAERKFAVPFAKGDRRGAHVSVSITGISANPGRR
jgi:hypothetical protein